MAQSGDGVDISAVYALLTQVSARLDGIEDKLNELVVAINQHSRKFDEVAGVLNEHNRKLENLTHGLTDLRDAVTHYHHSVVGHGIAVNRLDKRVKLLEEHLGLGPA